MSKKVKIGLGVLSVLIISFGSLVYYASTQISGPKIKKIAQQQLEKQFPGANVDIGDLKISLGTSIKLNIQKFDLNLKDTIAKNYKDKHLFSLKNLNVKIPVWAILTNGGTVDIVVDDPQANFTKRKDQSNWILAQKGKSTSSKKVQAPAPVEKSSSVSKNTAVSAAATSSTVGQDSSNAKDSSNPKIPSFLENSKVNIKVKELTVKYDLDKTNMGEVVISKILLKKLNFKSNSAFEIETRISSVVSEEASKASAQSLSFEARAIGDFNLSQIIKEKIMKSSVVITVNDLVVPGVPKKINMIKSDLKVTMDQLKNLLTVDSKTVVNSSININANIKQNQGNLFVDGIDLNIKLREALGLAGDIPAALDLGSASLLMGGKFSMSKGGKITPELEFNLSEPISYAVDQSNQAKISLKGALKKTNFKIGSIAELVGGSVEINGNSKMDLNKLAKDFAVHKLGPFYFDILATNFALPKEFIQKTLYSPKKKSSPKTTFNSVESPKKKGPSRSVANAKVKKAPKKSSSRIPLLPTVKANLEWRNIKIDNENFSGKGKILVENRNINLKNLKFNFSQGEGRVTSKIKLKENGSSNTSINFNLEKLNLEGLRPFLPKMLDNVKGVFSGKVAGSVSRPMVGNMKHDIKVNLNAENGELKGINVTEYVNGVIASVPLISRKLKKNDKDYKIDQNFKKLTFNGRFKESHYDLKDFYFLGLEDAIEIKGGGSIFPLPKSQNGSVEFTLKDNSGKILGKAKKDIGTDTIPIRVKGPQFNLTPDYDYTIKKLTKIVAKAQSKKQIRKVTDKLKDKLMKGDKKELKKLFKKFF